jgi:hypothetical protein
MLSWGNYWRRSVDIFTQFDLAKKALAGFRDTPEALNKFAEKELENLRNELQGHFEKKGKDPQESWLYNETKVQDYLDDTIKIIPSRLDDVVNRINQNHLIMQVTIFETFMKDIHKEVLRQNPALLNPDRKVSLGRAVSKGLEKIIEEEIAREVHGLDRKSIDERCDYFKNKLGIDWSFDGTAIPVIESILESRNTILHEDPDLKIKEEDTIISMSICMGIIMVSIVQAHLHYPEAFAPPDQAGNLRKHFEKTLKKPNSRTNG